MSYERKTRDVYEVLGDYGCGYDLLTTENTLKEARQCLRDYLENDHMVGNLRIRKRRVPK